MDITTDEELEAPNETFEVNIASTTVPGPSTLIMTTTAAVVTILDDGGNYETSFKFMVQKHPCRVVLRCVVFYVVLCFTLCCVQLSVAPCAVLILLCCV